MNEEDRIVIIVQHQDLEFLVFDHQPYKNPLLKFTPPHIRLGIWADVEEIESHQQAIITLVDELHIEDAPRYLYGADHAERPDDRYYTRIGIYYHICQKKPTLEVNGSAPLWVAQEELIKYLHNREFYGESQTAFTYFNVLGPQPRN